MSSDFSIHNRPVGKIERLNRNDDKKKRQESEQKDSSGKKRKE